MTAHAASVPALHRESLIGRRGIVRSVWDLLGMPLRFAVLPDGWSRACGWTSLEEERLRAVLPWLEGRVLDVGCGPNRLVKLHPGGGVGVDVFDFGGGATIIEDTRRLPFADASFDTVSFIACLNHIPYRGEALLEAWRVLRPGGRLVATMINRFLGAVGHAIWWYGEHHERGMLPGETGGLNVSEMKRLLHHAGFGAVELRRFCYGLNGLYLARKPDRG